MGKLIFTTFLYTDSKKRLNEWFEYLSLDQKYREQGTNKVTNDPAYKHSCFKL
jgi:hypothetical protein